MAAPAEQRRRVARGDELGVGVGLILRVGVALPVVMRDGFGVALDDREHEAVGTTLLVMVDEGEPETDTEDDALLESEPEALLERVSVPEALGAGVKEAV